MGAWAILDPQEGSAAVGMFDDPIAARMTQFWRVSDDDVKNVETHLAAGLRERGVELTAYNRRYVGVVVDGTKLIVVSAGGVETTLRIKRIAEERGGAISWDWRHQVFPVADGDTFAAAFDPSKNVFVAAHFDGFTVSPVAEADAAFEATCGRKLRSASDQCDPVTPAKAAAWRKTADLYARVVDHMAAPRVLPEPLDLLPSAALPGAIAFKQAGDVDGAVRMYRRLLDAYHADLQPPPERLLLLRMTYGAIAETYLRASRREEARAAYEELARDVRFDAKVRAEAKHSAESIR